MIQKAAHAPCNVTDSEMKELINYYSSKELAYLQSVKKKLEAKLVAVRLSGKLIEDLPAVLLFIEIIGEAISSIVKNKL